MHCDVWLYVDTHVYSLCFILQKLGGEPLPGKEYYVGFSGGFTIQHYAGKVSNTVHEFT